MPGLPIHCLVEGSIDEMVVRRVFSSLSIETGTVYHASIPAFETRLRRFNHAARHSPWFALCDLDQDECAPLRARRYLSDPVSGMCFRIAVRAVEAWLLADRETVARFLSVAKDTIPGAPENERDPKSRLVSIARRSRSRAIREGLAPAEGDFRTVGPEYALMTGEFVRDRWSPQRAADHAPSLRRTMERCRQFTETGQW